MADYSRAVRKVLSDHGCYFVRHGKGDHDIWKSPINNHSFPVDGTIKSRHSANVALKEAGIRYRF